VFTHPLSIFTPSLSIPASFILNSPIQLFGHKNELRNNVSATKQHGESSDFLFWEKISLFSYLSFGNSYHTMAKDTTVTKQSLLNLVMYQKQ